MKEIRITAKTKKGEEALRKHYEESKKIRLIHKITFRQMGYRQTIVCPDPYTLVIDITNPYFQSMLKEDKFTEEIHTAMKENGATQKDYEVKIK